MMCIPECLKALLADLRMRRGIYHQHAKQHDMSSDAASLVIVDLNGGLFSHLTSLHVEKVDIMGSSVHNRPKKQAICDLPMKPLALVEWKPSDLGPYLSQDVPTHWEEYQHHIYRQA